MTNLFTYLSNWKLKYICALVMLVCISVGNAWGGESTYTMKTSGSGSTAIETNWTANTAATFNGSGAYWTCSSTTNTFTITSGAGITGTITQVQVTGKRNKDMSYTIDCTVGGSALGSQYSHSASSGDYDTDDTFYNSTGLTGTIVITAVCAGGSQKDQKGSFWITAITVTTASATTYTIYMPYTANSCSSVGSYTSNKGTSGSGTGTWTGYKTYSGITAGTSVTITATPESGYKFDGWTSGGYSIIMDEESEEVTPSSTTSTTATFDMPSSDVYIMECAFSTACDANPSIGTASLNGSFF